MKKINTSMMITAVLIKCYITASRVCAATYKIIGNMKSLQSAKAIPAAKKAAMPETA